MKTISDAQIHKGHRSRMREKFLEHGAKIFDTYELLEMLLYSTIPAKDTNPMAKRLLAAFGSLGGVLGATREELMTVSGIGEKTADMITSVGLLGRFSRINSDDPELKFDDYKKIGEYFIDYFAGTRENLIAVMLLDNSMRLIAVKTVFRGLDYSHADVKGRDFVNLAFEHGASVVVVAHNHPHGPTYPCDGDLENNNAVSLSLCDVGVLLADHYIICGEHYFCFMATLEKRFSQQPELSNFYKTKKDAVGGAENVL